jgi:hypothetical protein
MPYQANTDANLSRAGEKQRGSGGRLLLIGAVMIAIGLVVRILGDDENLPAFIGVALMSLGAIPAIAGVALMLSGLVSGRAAKDKPFA